MMSGIRGRDTAPEKIVRSHLHRAGLRFGLHRKDLPGRPDIVLPRWRSAVFVHGCFWHRHPGCRYAYVPKSNRAFWLRKFAANVERDGRNVAELRKMKWRVHVVWECRLSTGRLEQLVRAIRSSRSH
jgi:DNA mismatch endonuclease (patch repair protein)